MSRKIVSLVGSCALVSTLLVAPGAAATRRPDLVVTSVTTASGSVAAGGSLRVTVRVKNRRRGRAPASEVRFYLDRNGVKDKADRRLRGSVPVGRLKARRTAKLSARLEIPRGTPPGAYLLLACADDRRRVHESSEKNNCRASSAILEVVPAPTSTALIQEAVDRGEITEEEGLTYEVYAAFGDDRLPDRFAAGGPADPHGGAALRKVAAGWGQLSAEARTTVAPFMAPPSYQGSWAEPVGSRVRGDAARGAAGTTACTGGDSPPPIDSDWTFLDTEHTKIWYRTVDIDGATAYESQLVAHQIAGEIEHIYTEVTTLFDAVPPPDFLETCDGGDDRIDIYVTPVKGLRAVTVPFPPGEILSPSFMLVDPAAATDEITTRDIVAHEFAHTLHIGVYDYAEDYLSYRWLEEATAVWVIDHIYPDDNVLEHEFAEGFFTDEFYDSIESGWTRNGYQDYLFLFYIARAFGPEYVKAIWDQVIVKDSVDAIDEAVPGGWKERWPEFAQWAWNDVGVDFLQQLDDISRGLPTGDILSPVGRASDDYPGRLDVKLDGKKRQVFELTKDQEGRPETRYVSPRAINYSYFTFPDDDVRSVTLKYFSFQELLTDGDSAAREFGKVQAWMLLADGSARVEDWTDKTEVELCRDRATEDVQELVLLYTNTISDAAEPKYSEGYLAFPQALDEKRNDDELIASRASCDFPAQWSGRASGTIRSRDVVETWTAEFTLEKEVEDTGYALYRPTPIEWNVDVEGTYPDGVGGRCSISGSVTWTDDGAYDPFSGLSIFEYGRPDFDDEYSIALLAGPPTGTRATENCPSGTEQRVWTPLNIPDEGESRSQPWTPGSTSLSGSRSYPSRMDDSIEVEFSWDLTAG